MRGRGVFKILFLYSWFFSFSLSKLVFIFAEVVVFACRYYSTLLTPPSDMASLVVTLLFFSFFFPFLCKDVGDQVLGWDPFFLFSPLSFFQILVPSLGFFLIF